MAADSVSAEVVAARERLERAYIAYADGFDRPPHIRRVLDAEVRAAIAGLHDAENANTSKGGA
ncbi:hypothetical protein [Kitasatospora sp. NPDC127116]|uniref:hypothetical protein n=1 Tax=Kitasatospora sp. NPDC127116 TaxID=3345367 RepID=UPI003634F23C